jgi:Zinc carboxypeptidase
MRIFSFTLLCCLFQVACSTTQRYRVKSLGARVNSLDQITIPFERDSNQSVTWEEAIKAYTALAAARPLQCQLSVIGKSDGGKPLHVFIISPDGVFEPKSAKNKKKTVVLINNGIHPGEPEGIDASILFARKVLQDTALARKYRDVVFLIIPVYNVDGSLNRSGTSRANQNGPEEYGFRGNARNLDLNRDFIKLDSENARTFIGLFQDWQPDFMVDNHTSNGADYSYTVTLLPTQASKLAPVQARQLKELIVPTLYADMRSKGWPMVPYVNEKKVIPDSGIVGFMDLPRYASGFASLFHTIGITTETHMLKPFKERLRGTYDLLFCVADLVSVYGIEIRSAKWEAGKYFASTKEHPLDWGLEGDQTRDSISFDGYEASYIDSRVHTGKRLFYDKTRPFTKSIPFFNTYLPRDVIKKPAAYIVPQAWREVVERLALNQVLLRPLANDTLIWVTSYLIKDYKTRDAYEGHYLHYGVKIDTMRQMRQYYEGDLVVEVPTYCSEDEICTSRFIMETLEPHAPDSYLAWNFFDGVMMQKEYFSDYVFEDLAEEYLVAQPELRQALQVKIADEPEWGKNGQEVLKWVYMRSPWYEPSHRIYPVARLE